MTQEVPPTEVADDVLIVLEQAGRTALGVRAVELSISAVKVRFAASKAQDPERVFRREVASTVRSICDGAIRSLGAVDRPGFSLHLRGLDLEGYAIATSVSEAGTRRYRLRIGRATGNALGIFNLSADSETGLALFTPQILSGPEEHSGSVQLFNDMLSQLYLPLVNLNAYLRLMLDGTAPGRGESLSQSVVQLKTRAETLQFAFDRLIAEMMVDRYMTEPGDHVQMLDSTAA